MICSGPFLADPGVVAQLAAAYLAGAAIQRYGAACCKATPRADGKLSVLLTGDSFFPKIDVRPSPAPSHSACQRLYVLGPALRLVLIFWARAALRASRHSRSMRSRTFRRPGTACTS